MSYQNSIEKLFKSNKTIFTTNDLALIWDITDRKRLNSRVKYYLRNKRLIHIYKGLYGYGEYTALDIAQKLIPLSYISLYTSSQMYGLTFQYYETIFCISLTSKKYQINGQNYEYHKIKESVFYNSKGLVKKGNITIANKERTICDLLYVFPGVAFDNLSNINTNLLQEIAEIYQNKRLVSEVAKLIAIIKKESKDYVR